MLRPRRRRGLTSPPLVNVEDNPGPKGRARRKSTPTKTNTPGNHLTVEQKEAIKAELLVTSNYSAIAEKLQIKRRTVKRWAERLDATGGLEKQSRANKRGRTNEPEVEDEDSGDEAPEPQKKKYKQCNLFEKGKIVAWSEDGKSVREIADRVNRSVSAVSYWRQRGQTGEIYRKPGSGRPRCTSATDDRAFKRRILDTLSPTTATTLASEMKGASGEPIASRWTIFRRLHEAGVTTGRRFPKPALSKKQIQSRLSWAKQHQKWTPEQWERVLWTDESPFPFFLSPGRNHLVWYLKNNQ